MDWAAAKQKKLKAIATPRVRIFVIPFPPSCWTQGEAFTKEWIGQSHSKKNQCNARHADVIFGGWQDAKKRWLNQSQAAYRRGLSGVAAFSLALLTSPYISKQAISSV